MLSAFLLIAGEEEIWTPISGSAADSSTAAASLVTAINLAAAASSTVSAAAGLTPWATVVLANPLYTGVGGILDPNFWLGGSPPAAGDTIYYDPTYITILTDAEIVSTSNNCSAVVQWYDGTQWVLGLVVITPNIVGYATVVSVAAGTLSVAEQLAASAASLVNASGSLLESIQFAGAASDVSTASATLTEQIALAGSATSASSADAVFGDNIAAHAQSLSSAGGALTEQIAIFGGALSGTSASGTLLNTTAVLYGGASVSSLATGTISTQIALLASAISLTSASASLAEAISMASSAASVSSASGALQLVGTPLSANAVSAAAANAALAVQIFLAGAADSLSSAAAVLGPIEISLSGDAISQSDLAAQISGGGPILQAAAASLVSAVGTLVEAVKLAAQAISLDAASGTIDPGPIVLTGGASSSSEAGAASMFEWVGPTIVVNAPISGSSQTPNAVAYGSFYQPVDTQIIYVLDWEDWLALRWSPLALISLGYTIRPTPDNGYQYVCVYPGRTDVVQPAFQPYPGAIIQDGRVQWECQPLSDASLAATVAQSSWSVTSGIIIGDQMLNGQEGLALINTLEALAPDDYDITNTIITSAGQQQAGTIQIKVR